MRLIDAEPIEIRYNTETLGRREMYEMVKNAPAIDAVQVIRCKDCKYYDTPKNFKKPYCVRGAYVKVNADDYCSKGKRK